MLGHFKKRSSAINKIIQNKKEPVTCIIGGSKISTKINVITNLIKNVNNIIIVGAMANNFLIFKGFKIGKSLIEKELKGNNRKIFTLKQKSIIVIFLFLKTCNVSTNFDGSGKIKKQDAIDKMK